METVIFRGAYIRSVELRNGENDQHVVLTDEDDIEIGFAAARYNVSNEATGHVIPKGGEG